jgi:hypothetical protein
MKAHFALLAFLGALIMPAEAQQRWCFVNNEGASNCAIASFEQCRQTSAGSGGFCIPEAPVGHRQPTPVAGRPMVQDASDQRSEQVNRRLDRKLNICRNC